MSTADASSTGSGTRPGAVKAVPVRHPGRWVAVVVIGVLVAMAVNSIVTNPSWDWRVPAGECLLDSRAKGRLATTLWLTVRRDG